MKFTELIDLLNLVQINVGRGPMPKLRCLRINYCYDLGMLPGELKPLKGLERMEGAATPKSFITRLQGIDSYKVGHVPNMTMESIDFKR